MTKKCIAEFIGTMVLVICGCGIAMVTTNSEATAALGVTGGNGVAIALAFGLSIVAMAYSVGNVSGCHVNPAVSVAMLINKKLTVPEFVGYVVSQVLGAIVGALILFGIFGGDMGLGTNIASSVGQGFAAEVVLTFIFVFAICGVTSKESFGSVAGIVIGLTLVLVHLLGLPVTGTSVNPARSFGPALVAMLTGATGGADAFAQVWVYILAPLIGGALAAIVYTFMTKED